MMKTPKIFPKLSSAPRVAPLFLVAVFLLSACGHTPKAPSQTPQTPAKSSQRGGGYYKDDGPADETPERLDEIPDAVPRVEPLHRAANRPYVVFGKSYVPDTRLKPFRQRGVASWYGKKFHGKKTSIGEPYDMFSMTAAHPTLALPSYARVTNVNNGKTVVVRVIDRGPFHAGRIIDLSYAAAHRLGYIGAGSATVEVESLLPDSDTPLNYTFNKPAPAEKPVKPVPSAPHAPSSTPPLVQLSRLPIPQLQKIKPLIRGIQKVQETQKAQETPEVPEETGSPSGKSGEWRETPTGMPEGSDDIETLIAQADLPETAGDEKTSGELALPPAQPASSNTGLSNNTSAHSESSASPAASNNVLAYSAPPAASSNVPASAGVFLQLGAFSSADNAENFRLRLAQEIDWLAEEIRVVAGDGVHRVQLGPYPDRESAEKLAQKVRETVGYTPSIVTKTP